MTEQDAITSAKYMAESINYSVSIYRDFNNNWCQMNLGVPEVAWPYDIKEMVGVYLYIDKDNQRYLKADDIDNWSEEDKEYIRKACTLEVAKAEFEKRSTIGSRFEWPEK